MGTIRKTLKTEISQNKRIRQENTNRDRVVTNQNRVVTSPTRGMAGNITTSEQKA